MSFKRKIFISWFFFIAINLFSQVEDLYSLKVYTTQDGLSQNEVTSIVQDKYGFLWFGTRGGLNRFDGYTFTQYKPEKNNINSIQNPSIECLYIDAQDRIWIGTKSGAFSYYNPKNNKFTHFNKLNNSLNRVLSFGEDLNRDLYVGSWYEGIVIVNNDSLGEPLLKDHSINCIGTTRGQPLYFGTEAGLLKKQIDGSFDVVDGIDGNITEFIFDNKNSYLWIVGWGYNLFRYNYLTGEKKEFFLPNMKQGIAQTFSLCQKSDGSLWIGTWGNGLYHFNQDTEKFTLVFGGAKGGNNSIILDIFEDKLGDIWVGTNNGGVLKYTQKRKFFTKDAYGDSITPFNSIRSVGQDGNKNYWIGTNGEGIFSSNDLVNFEQVHFANEKERIQKQASRKFILDGNDNFWLIQDNGIYIIKEHNKQTFIEPANFKIERSVTTNFRKVHDLLLTENELWVATQQEGLYYYTREFANDSFKLVRCFHSSLAGCELKCDRITSLTVDNKGELFISSYKGIFLFSRNDTSLVPLSSIIEENKELVCDIILSVCKDSTGNIWFGTPCSLNKLYYAVNGKLCLEEYTKIDGLADDYIRSVLADDEGNIWCATNFGLTKVNANSGEVSNYNSADGVTANTFLEDICFKDHKGRLFFATLSNILYFTPKDIVDDSKDVKLAISDFKILNEPVNIEPGSIIDKNINEVEEFILTYKDKEFSLELSSLDFRYTANNQYAYWLEGYNDHWVRIGTRRHISFNNLPKGEYKLNLKGTNSHGKWSSNIKTIKITVLPPPWKTPLAITLYILLLIAIVILISYMGVKQERLLGNVKLEKVYREQEHIMNEQKLSFFTNISHEIRTPLTLIVGPAKELQRKDLAKISTEKIKHKIDAIAHNADRLLLLINQLLEFRKVEVSKLSLNIGEYNINQFLKEVSIGFTGAAEQKAISFVCNLSGECEKLYFDKERLSVVLYNVLSNAFKYTPSKGRITLSADNNNNNFIIKVKDNGEGMTLEERENIFERFYQAKKYKGINSSGIGLSLSKTYIDMHGGTIDVDSTPGKGTLVTIMLKKGYEHLNSEYITDFGDDQEIFINGINNYIYIDKESINTKTFGSKILIVDDNQSVLNYINDILAPHYQIFMSVNGKEGLQKTIELMPDLVISDVMMPILDGYGLCKEIKTNERLAHIPVVLLTAKGTVDDMLYGTKKGADAYLTKPFVPEMLIETVKRLIAERKKLHEIYSKKIVLENTSFKVEDKDAIIIEKAIGIIHKSISDREFNAEVLATDMAMSHSTFYRTIKSITDSTPGEFIKKVKINYAAKLLRETNDSISEVAEKIGYLDLKSFRKIFIAQIGSTPTEYRKEN